MGGAYHCTVTWAGTSQHWCHRLETSAKKAIFLYSCALMFIIPMYDHQTTFCFVLFLFPLTFCEIVSKYCDLRYWNPHLKSMQHWALPRQGPVRVMGGWCSLRETSYHQDTLPSLPFQRGGIMCIIVSANIFVKKKKKRKKEKKCRMTSWFWEGKKYGESCCSWTLWP